MFKYVSPVYDNINPGCDNDSLVIEAQTRKGSVIVKIKDQAEESSSPFWIGMHSLFGTDRLEALQVVESLSKYISDMTEITRPRVIGSYAGCEQVLPFVIYEKIDGIRLSSGSDAEGSFKGSGNIASELGNYLAKLHAITYDKIGNLTESFSVLDAEKYLDSLD